MPPNPILTFADLQSTAINKRFLSGPYGQAWQTTFGSALDTELVRQVWARRSKLPSWAPTDALTYIGSDRMLERVIIFAGRVPGLPATSQAAPVPEGEPQYRERLRTGWAIWHIAGSQQSHINELGWAGLQSVSAHRRAEWSMPDETQPMPAFVRAFQRTAWAQFDVLVDQPNPWQPVYWGQFNWGDGTTWGSSATAQEIAMMKRLIQTFKSAHDTAMWLVINMNAGARVWGSFNWGDGTRWSSGTGVAPMRVLIGEKVWNLAGLA